MIRRIANHPFLLRQSFVSVFADPADLLSPDEIVSVLKLDILSFKDEKNIFRKIYKLLRLSKVAVD